MSEIIIKGRNAKVKVLAALATAFPGKVPGWTVDNSHISKETKMTNQDALLDVLESELTKLEHLIDKQIAKKATRNENDDDLSAAADDNDPDDNGEDEIDEDNGDNLDDDDEEDQIGKAAPPHHHKFESVSQRIAAERKLPLTAAAQAARVENPVLFRDYQSSGLQNNAANSGQQLTTYEKMVQQEIRKGCSANVARQRVSYAHPALARHQTIAKAAASPAEFMGRVDQVMQARDCSRTAAMQTVRKQFPELFRKFQNV